jgi:hypothetical protein
MKYLNTLILSKTHEIFKHMFRHSIHIKPLLIIMIYFFL